MNVIGKIRLACGEAAFYDAVSHIYLRSSGITEIEITDNMDLTVIAKSVKAGRLELISGAIPDKYTNPTSVSDIKTITVNTVAELNALTSVVNGDTAIVKTDENNGSVTTIYTRENNAWVYKMAISAESIDTSSLLTAEKTVVGAINEVFQSASNLKQSVVTAITGKGGEVSNDSTAAELGAAIDNLSTEAKKIKLNITAPYVKDIVLTDTVSINNLCASLIKYTPGDGEVRYLCAFDNADSSNFQSNTNVAFDGTMHPLDSFSYAVTADASNIYSSDLIDVSKFASISIITFNDTAATFIATVPPQLVLPTGDINLTGIESIDSIILSGTATGESKVLLIMSFDSGLTWHGYDGVALSTVDIGNIADIRTKGMTIEIANTSLAAALNAMDPAIVTIRFGYFLEQKLVSDTCENDAITLNVALNGADKICPTNYYTMTYNELTHTITYNINTSGTYTFNYVD